jgi:Putative Flp pilus-assembly TadE/G-like
MKRFVKDLVSSTAARLCAFGQDESGSILQMTGLSIIPLMLAAGVAIDTSRVNFAHQKLASGLDAGALAAATMVNKTQAEMEAEAKRYLDANFLNGDTITIQSFKLTDLGQEILFEATARVPMSMMKIGGIDYQDIKLASTVVKDGSSVEVSLVLDNTGSMGPYMADLKTAAKDFLDTVVQPASPPYYTRVALIPYNRAVNLGSSAAAARGGVGSGTSTTPGSTSYQYQVYNNTLYTGTISNCVSERTGPERYTDASVSSFRVGRVYIPNGSTNGCNIGELKALSDDKASLKSAIDTMTAGGSTAGQVGIAWGWYMLSPNFGLYPSGSTPAAYGTEKLRKVMVLMTDGEFNSAYCNGAISSNQSTALLTNGMGNQANWGSGGGKDQIKCSPDNDSDYKGTPLDSTKPAGLDSTTWADVKAKTGKDKSVYRQSKALCAAIKAKGIEIFTIEFQLDTNFADRVDLVSSCATDASHRVTASDGASLKAAFKKIAASLGDPRVAK